jgi:hypothetical protein
VTVTDTDIDAQNYATGRALGMLAADGLHLDALRDAEASWSAAPYTLAQAKARAAMLPTRSTSGRPRADMLRHSGVLAGFKLATEGRPDAVECASCERRLFTESTAEITHCPHHNWLHDECRASICTPGLTAGCYLP